MLLLSSTSRSGVDLCEEAQRGSRGREVPSHSYELEMGRTYTERISLPSLEEVLRSRSPGPPSRAGGLDGHCVIGSGLEESCNSWLSEKIRQW